MVCKKLRLRVHALSIPSFFLMAAVEGGAAFGIIMLSALFHEFGHLLCIRQCGVSVRRVDLMPMGAVICYPREETDHKTDLAVSLSGPLFSLLLALLFCIAFFVQKNVFFLFGTLTNLFLGFGNMLPHSSLDGGRALFAWLSQKSSNEKAEQICSAVSRCSKLIVFFAAAAVCLAAEGNLGVVLLTAAVLAQL